MKLFLSKIAPSAKKISIYLKEKGIDPDVEFVEINILANEQNSPEYKKINPLGKVPVLQLDDDSCINESLSIIEYFEEIYPQNSMFGETPEKRAKTKAIERFIETEIMSMMAVMAHNIFPLFSKKFNPSAEVIAYCRKRQIDALEYLDNYIGERTFVIGNKVSVADITLFLTFETAHLIDATINPKYKNIIRCLDAFAKRASVRTTN